MTNFFGAALMVWRPICHKILYDVYDQNFMGGRAAKGARSSVVSRGALPYKPIRDVPFFRVSFFSINS